MLAFILGMSQYTHMATGNTCHPIGAHTMENVTRTKVLGRSIIIRKRVSKRKPIGYASGSCFHKLDAGYWSLYVSLRKPQRKVGFGKITDK